ncbi:MAG: hydroxymethylglutaryl-CoA reductase, degradative [Pseudomonadota bacterium]
MEIDNTAKNIKISFDGFSKLSFTERLEKLQQLGYISDINCLLLNGKNKLYLDLAERFIENAIGYFELPFGVAVNFLIDGQDYVIPMVVEETSIIAACSKTAKWIRQHGTIETRTVSNLSIGQIQFNRVADYPKWAAGIEEAKPHLIEMANDTIAKRLCERGGGLKDLKLRHIKRPDGGMMGIVHLLIDTCDAMGANSINQISQYLMPKLEEITQTKALMYILSNLTDSKLTEAKITLYDIENDVGEKIQEASLFAQLDPYRAATNNKGILNGIDAVLIATGNDWRAVEAGVHAFAARNGHYASLSDWQYVDNKLIGTMQIPLSLGIVGGVTQLHPMAKLAMAMLQVNSAKQLARIIAAVGLVQNLGALKALVTQGICPGHMKLHIDNICAAIEASEAEKKQLAIELQQHLTKSQYISNGIAHELLTKIRKNKSKINI